MQRELESASPSVAGKLVSQSYLHHMEWQRSRLQYDLGQVRAGVELIQSLSAQPVHVQAQLPPLVHVDMSTPPPFERQVDDNGKRYATRGIILEAVDHFVNEYEIQIQQAIISHDHLKEKGLATEVCDKACKRIAIKTRNESLVSKVK
jgi:hypothetical protein